MPRGDHARAIAWSRFLPWLLLAAGLAVYANSFSGVFVLDDELWIVDNPQIRRLWPIGSALAPPPGATGPWRPVLSLSLTVNYALGGLDVWGYHAFNLTVHLLAALVLYGLVRRTLLSERLRGRYEAGAPWLAFITALLWAVHPLQTGSVTYIVQRAESLTGLFCLFSVYSAIRSVRSPRRSVWFAGAIGACALGMATKAVMVTAPLLVLAYDRVFLAGSVREAWRQRRSLYLGLAATCGVLIVLLLSAPQVDQPTAGFGLKVFTPLEYAATQPGVILHYLRLVVWPHPLVLNYEWGVARGAEAVLPQAVLIGCLLMVALWAWRWRPALGFAGAWFVLTLAPSSSVIPIADLAFEHRMYLPLAAVVGLGVVGLEAALRRWAPAELRRPIGACLVAALAIGWGAVTIRRNADYHSAVAIWSDTVAKRPQASRPLSNLGFALGKAGRYDEAVEYLEEALRRDPRNGNTYSNLGLALAKQGRFDEAIQRYQQALELDPDDAKTHNNLGLTLVKLNRLEEAIDHYTQALRLRPHDARFHSNLGLVYGRQGRYEEAIERFRTALRFDPRFTNAYNNLGDAFARQGKLEDAVRHFAKALRIQPDHAVARRNLRNVLAVAPRLRAVVDPRLLEE